MLTELDPATAAAVTTTSRDWACAVYHHSGLTVPPEHLERVFASLINELLELACSEPFPAEPARRIGRRLAEAPFDRTRSMLAPASRALLGFAPGYPRSLVASRWPLVASHALESYAEALQQQALAQQQANLDEKMSVRVQEIVDLHHQLRHEATHDALTDLANRSLLQQRVRMMTVNGSGGVGLLLIDVDDFKQINDGYGHSVGDEVLVEISRRLRVTCPPDTVVCRYGGDEFVLALPTRRNTLREVAVCVLAALHDPVSTDAGPVPVSASVGVAYCPPDSTCDFADLLRSADRAMYSAKTAGKRRFAISEPEYDEPEPSLPIPVQLPYDVAAAG
ncbi:GGDEF domain-containing protein [Nocardia macrotermitis]|uniref:GGDEF domain-containing protein n=1 Tax=Nocardia macrotermitis TaxID=2585198 RepID=A0A7K0D3S0_9NOCA|nr:GGDEF domain-containing protein [Nocardia macrotermitis]MQY20359.1 hypothetical protein [Nocardia macrotermitis]